jgi:hypothetical protein
LVSSGGRKLTDETIAGRWKGKFQITALGPVPGTLDIDLTPAGDRQMDVAGESQFSGEKRSVTGHFTYVAGGTGGSFHLYLSGSFELRGGYRVREDGGIDLRGDPGNLTGTLYRPTTE